MSNHTPPFDHEHDLLDFADRLDDGQEPTGSTDLESTVLRVQRSLRGDAAEPDAMPDDLKTHIWEDIMQSTGAAHAAAPETPWQETQPRPKRRARRTPARATNRPIPPQRMRWSRAANIALSVLLVVAAFGAVRAFDGSLPFDFGGDNGPTEPRLAAIPGTPDESILPAVQGTPVESTAAVACDFSEPVPLVNGTSEPQGEGTVLFVTQSHDLMIRCDEEPDDILLAEDIARASPTHWPGVVRLGVNGDGYEPTPVLLNVLTNEWLEYGRENSAMNIQGTEYSIQQSPFIVTALPDDSSTWALTDMRTMESRSLSELGGVDWPRSSSIYVSDTGPEGSYAVAVFNDAFSPDSGPALLQPEGFPGEIMLVSDSLDAVSWIDVPDGMTSPYRITLSPDGEHVAVLGMERPGSPGSATISIMRTSDGSEITRTETFKHNVVPNTIWVQDGDALVYPQSGALMMLEATPESSPQPLLESPDRLFALSATHHPDVVTISESAAPQHEWRGDSDRVFAVNTRTGSIESFEGKTWQPGAFTGTAWQVQAAIILIEQDDEDSGTTTVIDPATGDIMLEIPRVPTEDSSRSGMFDEQFPADTLAVSQDRGTVAFSIRDERSLVVADVSADPAVAREIAFPDFTPPEDTWSTQVSLSPDGSGIQLMVYTEQEREQWSFDLSNPDAEWVPLPDGSSMTWFMPTDQ